MKRKPSRYFRQLPPLCLITLPLLAFPGAALAVTGTWNVDSASSWSTAANWLGGVIPNGVGHTAELTFNITANRTISLSGDKTVGNLLIGDRTASFFGYSLNAGTPSNSRLIFDQTGDDNATLTVPDVGGSVSNVLSSTVLLRDNLVIDTRFGNSSSPQITLSGYVVEDGTPRSILKAGPGILVVSGSNNFSGGVQINAGRVTCNTQLRALGGGAIQVAAGGQLYLNTASCLADVTLAGNGYTNPADTGAQQGSLRFENLRGIVGNVTIAQSGARIGGNTTALGFISGNLSGSGDLEVNSTATTTGGLSLLGSAAGYTGTLYLARGGFRFDQAFGGSIDVASAGASTVLATGTSLGGDLILDSSLTQAVLRNTNGTLAIAGKLELFGNTILLPSRLPDPGQSTLTIMTYAAKEGDGGLLFDPTGYRGSPVLQVGPTAAQITGLDVQTRTWNPQPARIWSISNDTNWSGGDGLFRQGDAVVFTDAGAGAVNLSGVLNPSSILFSNTDVNDYTVTGSGTLDGLAGGIRKTGDAWLTLGGSNTFSGPVSVEGGRLILGSTLALGLTSGVTVAEGAVLDLNGQLLIGAGRQFDVSLAGQGDAGQGALTNAGPTIQFQGSPRSGVRNVTLTADASIGCDSGKMFDIGGNGVVDGQNHTLTKVGAGQLYLLGAARNLNLVVNEGIVSGFGPDPFGTNLTIRANGTASAATQGIYSSHVTFESGGTLSHAVGTLSKWTGTITCQGNVNFSNGNTSSTTLEIVSGFHVPGNLNRSGGGQVQFSGDVTVAGSATVDGGNLILGSGETNGSLTATEGIQLTAALSRLVFDRAADLTLGSTIGGVGGITKNGPNVLTLQADNSYTGTTTVNAGTLRVEGVHGGSGAVTVAAGASLAGGGTMPGAVTISAGATLAPGPAGSALTVGSASLQGSLALTCNAQGTSHLRSLGSLTLGAASALTLDVSEVPAEADFLPVARYTTLTGTFSSVTGVPQGYDLVYNHVAGDETLIALVRSGPADPYLAWIGGFYPGETNPAIIGPDADPDGDGLSNRLENYLGSSPASPSQGLAAVVAGESGFRFEHPRADNPLPAQASYEWSLDLATWHASGAEVNGTTVSLSPTVKVDHPSPAADEIQVDALVTGAAIERLFARLKVSDP